MVYCAQCGTENAASSFCCQKCGAILERDLESTAGSCPECSRFVNPGDAYCRGCGASLYLLQDTDSSVGQGPERAPENSSTFPEQDSEGAEGNSEALPGWLRDYLGEAGEDTSSGQQDQEVWLSDFAELQKSIESSAFLSPDEVEEDQPTDVTAWLKDLDLPAEASALVEQLHSSPPDSQPEASLSEEPLEAARPQETETFGVDRAEPAEWELVPEELLENVEEEIQESSLIEEFEESTPAGPPEESKEEAPEPEHAETISSEEVVAGTGAANETPAETGHGTPDEPSEEDSAPYEEFEGLAERRVALRNQPVALMVPFKMPQPIPPRTPAGEAFASISGPQAGMQVKSPAGMLTSSKTRSRVGWLLALVLVLIVLLIVAYLYIFQVLDFGFTSGSMGAKLVELKYINLIDNAV